MATELPIIQCTLDTEGAREQAARYAEVAQHVTSVTRTDRSLVAAVDTEVPSDLMKDLITTERACCAFFDIAWEGQTLSYSVAHAEHAAALDVIQAALTR
jgi:hypothetical protein